MNKAWCESHDDVVHFFCVCVLFCFVFVFLFCCCSFFPNVWLTKAQKYSFRANKGPRLEKGSVYSSVQSMSSNGAQVLCSVYTRRTIRDIAILTFF